MAFELVEINVHTQLTPAAAASSIVTVPDSTYWKVTAVNVILATTATVGNRVPLFYFTNVDGSTIFSLAWDATIAASRSAELQTIKGGADRNLALPTNRNHIVTGFSDLMLPPAAQCQFYDWAAIDAANDTVLVAVSYEAYREMAPAVQPIAIISMPAGKR